MDSKDDLGPEYIINVYDPSLGMEGFLVIDNTFNINKDCLPFLIAVRVLNFEYIFSVVFSYISFENKESFIFFWDFIKAEYFITDKGLLLLSLPYIILGN